MSIPETFWEDCVVTIAYLINHMPTRVLDGQTPFEVLFGKRPEIHHLRVFVRLCYVTTLGPCDKMSPRVRRCIFMGYPTLHKGYHVFKSSTSKFFTSREVIFQEEIFPFQDEVSSIEPSRSTHHNGHFLYEEDLSPISQYMLVLDIQNSSLVMETSTVSPPTPDHPIEESTMQMKENSVPSSELSPSQFTEELVSFMPQCIPPRRSGKIT